MMFFFLSQCFTFKQQRGPSSQKCISWGRQPPGRGWWRPSRFRWSSQPCASAPCASARWRSPPESDLCKMIKPSWKQSPQPTQNFWVYSEFLSFFVLYSRILADFLSHLGKWVKLIKFDAENEFFCIWKVEKPQSNTSTPSFYNVHATR